MRRPALGAGTSNAEDSAIATPPNPLETHMTKPLQQFLSLAFSVVVTAAMLGGIDLLAHSEQQSAQLVMQQPAPSSANAEKG
jgi:hypothetical protein